MSVRVATEFEASAPLKRHRSSSPDACQQSPWKRSLVEEREQETEHGYTCTIQVTMTIYEPTPTNETKDAHDEAVKKVIQRSEVASEVATATRDCILREELAGASPPSAPPLPGFPARPDDTPGRDSAARLKETYEWTVKALLFLDRAAADERAGATPEGYGKGKFPMERVLQEVDRMEKNVAGACLTGMGSVPHVDTSGLRPEACDNESDRVQRDYVLTRDTAECLDAVTIIYKDM
ncbi:PREDICTED: uncharacterized protein LOC106810372 [Priapulus caudatus]|uniref:Uncharacterized protein LOC106810372 n=1 Tax=Priapulus caudatus TaxID=37621 RepID=A0ABM1EAF6_PRICU|nr:PREDICTED: uncharacterized protein LOC106810372 [Priapulus caudatus]